MKVKLQPPSGTDLAPFNPILPPASITQIMLLANPAKAGDIQTVSIKSVLVLTKQFFMSSQEKARLRYKLAFTLGDRLYNEVGEVDQFPPPEAWGHL